MILKLHLEFYFMVGATFYGTFVIKTFYQM